MSILVVGEHDSAVLKPVTLHVIAAAKQIGQEIDLLLVGKDIEGVTNDAIHIEGVAKVLSADDAVYEHGLAENVAKLVAQCAENYDYVIAAHTSIGRNFMPRVAALLDVAQISDIIAVESPSIFRRPIYAGNAIATVEALDKKKVLTVRGTAFDPVQSKGGSATLEKVEAVHQVENVKFLQEEIAELERPELTDARVVISGGRALGSGENFKLLEALADKLGAAIGASRAAVDAGYVPNDMQVGQTGKVVAPELYIAVGISGAIQHLAGMKDSKVIVAINNDEEAPIFKICDYGLVADLFEVLPKLNEML